MRSIDQITQDHPAKLLKRLRQERRMSMLQLADEAKVNPSVVCRAERGLNATLDTWIKLFDGLGYRLLFDVVETSEDVGGFLEDEAARRRARRRARR